MHLAKTPARAGQHDNAFGFIRLVLASLVIVSHTPELMDGNRSREPLSLFFKMSFGEFSVAGFFVVSGFLLTGSLTKNKDALRYLSNRAARIYPAFLVMSLLCVFFVAPLAGGVLSAAWWDNAKHAATNALILNRPEVPGVFAGTPYDLLNGPAWTLQYEFFCYIMLLAFCRLGMLKTRWIIVFVALVLHAAYIIMIRVPPPELPSEVPLFKAGSAELVKLAALFMSGSAYYLFQQHIGRSRLRRAFALTCLLAAMLSHSLANLGFGVFGSYLLVSLARWGSGKWIARVNDDQNDISYGLYLYAWPVEKLLLWWQISANLVVLAVLTWGASAALGALSWYTMEKPVMGWVRRRGHDGLNGRKESELESPRDPLG